MSKESDETGALDWPQNVTALPRADRAGQLRIIEAMLFASAAPLSAEDMEMHLDGEVDVGALLEELQNFYASRGVNLVRIGEKWAFRTASDLGFLLRHEREEEKRLSKAALETLAIIAYHQPVTRAEIEDVRGVSASKGTLDMLLDMGWIRLMGRRRTPGRPVTFGTTEAFLEHFGLEATSDLPGMSELKAAGLLNADLPREYSMSAGDRQSAGSDTEDSPGLFSGQPDESGSSFD